MPYWILVIIIFSLILVILCLILMFYADIVYYIKSRKIQNIEKKIQKVQTLSGFGQELVIASQKMVRTGKRIEYPILEADTFIRRSRIFLSQGDRASLFSYKGSESGWLLLAMAEYMRSIQYVKSVFDDKILNIPIQQIEQSQSGMIALLIYKNTREIKYKEYADKICKYLISLDTDYGIVFRESHKGNIVLIDSLGMAVPFLIEYGKLFDDDNVIRLAEKSFEQYIKFGVDTETGIPVFAYRIASPHVKLGSPNWGRGVAWFSIGLLYVDKSLLTEHAQDIIKKFEKSLLELWSQEECFGHFLGEGKQDLSAELPILYYLCSKKLLHLSPNHLAKYSTMSYHGLMYHSSSSNVGIVRYGTCTGPNVLSQAYMLRLLHMSQKNEHCLWK